MIRMSQIRIPIDVPEGILEESLKKKIRSVCRMPRLEIVGFRIVKESVDARKKPDITLVYTVELESPQEDEILKKASERGGIRNNIRAEKSERTEYTAPVPARVPEDRPVVAGFGPCGMFAALSLAEAGLRPIVLERGRAVEDRIRDVEEFWKTGRLDTESNVQFGEGGAGTFSDGKLTTGIKDCRIEKVKREFVSAGADASIMYRHMPHIGTDVLRDTVKNIRKKIISLGGEIRFETKLSGISSEGGRITGVLPQGGAGIPCSRVVLAPGNSSRDTFRMLFAIGLPMEIKAFSAGVRIEHRRALIDAAQYGSIPENDSEGRLSAAVYKLSHRCKNGRGVYTFCMCPGGYVVGAASEAGGVVTNGMSYFARDGENSNSAVLVDVRPEDCYGFAGRKYPLAGVEFQEHFERLAFKAGVGAGAYFAPVQTLGDFLKKNGAANSVEPTYRPGICWTDMDACLPGFVAASLREALPEFGKKLKGFDADGAVITGVETRSSSPVRILRDENCESIGMRGLYPGGEGAGYAGGIISAAVDGIKISESIIKSY